MCKNDVFEIVSVSQNLFATPVRYVHIRPRDMRLIKSVAVKAND